MLYAAPIVLIVAGRIRGCRPEEQRMITAIACVMTIAFIPAAVVGVFADLMLVKGCAYALVTLAAVHWAMLLGRRPGDDGRGGSDTEEGPVSPEPEDFDWDDFERGFWDEVRRRERIPA